MGTSFRRPDRSVWSLMRDVLPDTIVLAVAALLVAWTVAIPLGTVAAARLGQSWDKVASAAAARRNALLPVMTIGAAQLGALLSGTVVTEKIFERPGLGTLFLDAFFARDIPVVQGCVLVIALIYVAVNLVVDLAYGVVDPRVRLS